MWIHVLVYVSISFLFFSCTDRKTKPEKIDFNKKPVQVMQNILLYRSDKGEVYARLEAKTVQYYSGDSAKTVFPDGIKVLIYNKDMTDKSLLTANYAVNYTSSSDLVYIKDSVKIINFNTQDTIYCRDLYWNQDAKTVYSHNPIRRYTQGGETFGDGMTANEQFDSVVVIRPHGKESFSEEE